MSFTVETMLVICTLLFVLCLFHVRLIVLFQLFLVQILLLFARKDRRADSEETMEKNFRAADQTKSHAETQQTSWVGNVGCLGDLLVFLEPLCVRILDEDVEHDQVFSGVVQDHFFDWASSGGAVWDVLTGNVPIIVFAKFFRIKPTKKYWFLLGKSII